MALQGHHDRARAVSCCTISRSALTIAHPTWAIDIAHPRKGGTLLRPLPGNRIPHDKLENRVEVAKLHTRTMHLKIPDFSKFCFRSHVFFHTQNFNQPASHVLIKILEFSENTSPLRRNFQNDALED